MSSLGRLSPKAWVPTQLAGKAPGRYHHPEGKFYFLFSFSHEPSFEFPPQPAFLFGFPIDGPTLILSSAEGENPLGKSTRFLEVIGIGMRPGRSGHIGPGFVFGRVPEDFKGLEGDLAPAGKC